MTTTEIVRSKKAMEKVAALLQGVYLLLQSALTALQIYAPKQENLITVLTYLSQVIKAVLQLQPLPSIPPFLLPLEDNDERAFALLHDGEGNELSTVDLEDSENRAITSTLGDIIGDEPDAMILMEAEPAEPGTVSENNPQASAIIESNGAAEAMDTRAEEMLTRESPINP